MKASTLKPFYNWRDEVDVTAPIISRFKLITHMRSIEASYAMVQHRNQNLGAYSCLVTATKGRKFSRKSLISAFKKIVPIDDYLESETRGLINHLEVVTNMAVEVEK